MANYIGLLQEKCNQGHKNLPCYVCEEETVPNSLKKCFCKLYNWVTEGTGVTKNQAKHNAAELMLALVEQENWSKAPEKVASTDNVTTKVNLLADKKNQSLCTQIGKKRKICSLLRYNLMGILLSVKELVRKLQRKWLYWTLPNILISTHFVVF